MGVIRVDEVCESEAGPKGGNECTTTRQAPEATALTLSNCLRAGASFLHSFTDGRTLLFHFADVVQVVVPAASAKQLPGGMNEKLILPNISRIR